MSTHTASLAAPPLGPHGLGRVRALIGGVGAAVLGAAPHVLHHVGPLAGAALLAGAGGKLLFGAIGFVAAVPMLRGLRRRTGSWRVPAALLSAMAVMFTFSTLVIGPALTDDGNERPANPGVSQPAGKDHDSHHP